MSDDNNWEVEPDPVAVVCILQGGIAITINMLINNNTREDGKNDRWNTVCLTCARGVREGAPMTARIRADSVALR